MALPSRSRPSGLSLCSRRQRVMMKPADIDSTALSANTQALPAAAIKAPATSGPMMREAFIETPLSASAAGNCVRGTTSGTMAANTGQRIASPTPLAKVSASSSGADIQPIITIRQVTVAMPATQNCVSMRKRRRSRMSASAPLGRPSRNTGSVEADCTSATHSGEGVNEVMSQALATSFIHMVVLAASQVNHSMRNTGLPSGASAESDSSEDRAAAVSVECSGM